MKHFSRGMTLIEVVASLGIFAAIIVAASAVARLSPLGNLTHDEDVALTAADTEIEALRSAGYSSLVSGSFTNSAVSALNSGSGSVTVSSFNAETKSAAVEVSWTEPSGSRSITLTTLITESGGLP